MRLLIVIGMAIGLAGCAALIPAAVGGAAGYVVAKGSQPPPDYIPPRPKR